MPTQIGLRVNQQESLQVNLIILRRYRRHLHHRLYLHQWKQYRMRDWRALLWLPLYQSCRPWKEVRVSWTWYVDSVSRVRVTVRAWAWVIYVCSLARYAPYHIWTDPIICSHSFLALSCLVSCRFDSTRTVLYYSVLLYFDFILFRWVMGRVDWDVLAWLGLAWLGLACLVKSTFSVLV